MMAPQPGELRMANSEERIEKLCGPVGNSFFAIRSSTFPG